MRLRLDIHVLSDVPKDLGPNVTVHVGLPTRNPRSLPFAHRRLFAEQIANADYFIYCEDDTLITERNIRAFLEVDRVLDAGEIAGFLRVERISPEECYVESAHGPYRWDASTLVRRGSWTFASFTNFHSALTMASRAQVQKAIDSGGFVVGPHVGRFGMLECAASDLYTQCGLNRLICISRIEDFMVPHLPNTNCLKWGLRYEEFLQQTRAFQEIDGSHGWKGSLFEVETHMTRGRWSKNLYERPDPTLLERIPRQAKTVLSVGCGWGGTEEYLAKNGMQVTGIPVDAVFADCLRRRGIEAIEGCFEEALEQLRSRQFDVVMMLDVLHLVPNPIHWLSLLRPYVNSAGVVLATAPRTFDPLRMIWYLRGEPATAFPKRFEDSRVQRVNRPRLRKWFDTAGMDAAIFESCNTPTRVMIQKRMRGLWDRSLTDRFVVLAKSR